MKEEKYFNLELLLPSSILLLSKIYYYISYNQKYIVYTLMIAKPKATIHTDRK